jgi:type I restriction enzyme, S subunit
MIVKFEQAKWKTKPLGDLCTIVAGGTPSRGKFHYYGGGIPWVKISDMLNDPIIRTEETITQEGLDNSTAKLLPAGTLLISIFATIGRTAVLGTNATTNQAIVGVIPKKGVELDIRFLRQYLDHSVSSLVNQARGVAQSNINGSILKRIEVPLPLLAEQKRIADILDKAVLIRRKRHEAREELPNLVNSQFLEMFGDPLMNLRGWDVLPLAEVVQNRDSLRIPLKESDRGLRHGQYPYYGSVGVIDHIDDYIYEGEHLLISEDGKHLESRNRPITCLATEKFWVNNHAHVLADNGTADLCFLAWQIEHRPIREYVTGIDQFKLNRGSLDRIPVCVPPIELQKQFRRFYTHAQRMEAGYDDALSSSNDLFNSLVQRAFRGEL